MTMPLAELAGLPTGGPATLEAVKVHLDIPADDTADDARLSSVVSAVNGSVRRFRVAADALATDPAAWPGHITHGATLLAARLWRRKNSPAGVESFGDLGAAYVMRNDPDIAMLLRLGTWQTPAVG